LKVHSQATQKDALIKFLADHKEDADLVASGSWLLFTLTHGYVHFGKADDVKTKDPKRPQKPRPIPDDAVLHVLSGDNLPIFMKNYRLITGGQKNYVLEFGLDTEGTAWLVGWSVYPSGENTDYWKNQTIAVMLSPILGCYSDSALSEYTEYSYTSWDGVDGTSLSVLYPDTEDIWLTCGTSLRMSGAPEASISGVKQFSSKRLKTSESTSSSSSSSSSSTTSSTSETTTSGQKKRKATDK